MADTGNRTAVAITTAFIKLDALLKFCGAAETGGQAKEMIQGGLVLADGQVCLQRGRKIYPGSVIKIGSAEYEVVSG